MTGHYDVAQVCQNGHITNQGMNASPQFNKDHCDKCGEKIVSVCEHCSTPIQGRYRGRVSVPKQHPPAYCHSCGNPFVWTQRTIESAIELSVEIGGLGGADAEQFRSSLDDVLKETPRTPLAASRLRGLLRKTGQEAAGGIRHLIIDLVSETVKKTIWPNE